VLKWKRAVGSGEAQEHGCGACMRAGLTRVYRSSLEKAKSVNLYRFEKQPARGSRIGLSGERDRAGEPCGGEGQQARRGG
jgi:hypothetical protein